MLIKISFIRAAGILGVALFLSPLATYAQASAINVLVVDSSGQAVQDAVVYIEMESKKPAAKASRIEEIEQKGRKFAPLVTVIETGTNILFPNHDSVRHHIYSVSPAKIFEQKLYAGIPEKSVLFDKPGVVVLGCNIHDQMLAYIFVVDSPYFAKTDAQGKAKIDVPSTGKFEFKTWHFNARANTPLSQPVVVKDGVATVTVKLDLKASVAKKPAKAPSSDYEY